MQIFLVAEKLCDQPQENQPLCRRSTTETAPAPFQFLLLFVFLRFNFFCCLFFSVSISSALCFSPFQFPGRVSKVFPLFSGLCITLWTNRRGSETFLVFFPSKLLKSPVLQNFRMTPVIWHITSLKGKEKARQKLREGSCIFFVSIITIFRGFVQWTIALDGGTRRKQSIERNGKV